MQMTAMAVASAPTCLANKELAGTAVRRTDVIVFPSLRPGSPGPVPFRVKELKAWKFK
jgi:hypothetical protein